jgi:hypothetical protein
MCELKKRDLFWGLRRVEAESLLRELTFVISPVLIWLVGDQTMELLVSSSVITGAKSMRRHGTK